MMTKVANVVLLAGLVLTAHTQGALAADAAKENKVQSTPQKTRGGAPDTNVKTETLKKNSPASAGKTAARKGGEKSRQALCVLHVDNHTDLIIQQIFVDGNLVGSVEPGGDSYGTIACGSHVIYAKAFFDDGTVNQWGPQKINCPVSEEECTWTLIP